MQEHIQCNSNEIGLLKKGGFSQYVMFMFLLFVIFAFFGVLLLFYVYHLKSGFVLICVILYYVVSGQNEDLLYFMSGSVCGVFLLL